MSKYKHKEAFCLMRYVCPHCHHQEIIWNSRDGVTPFGTRCPSCSAGMSHAYFGSDKCVSDHKLNKFQKYWRDGTDEEARMILKHRCIDFRARGYDMGGVDDETFIEEVLADGHEFQKGWPRLDIYLGETL